MNSFVGAVGENEIVGIDPEEGSEVVFGVAVFGVQRKAFFGEGVFERFDNRGGSADSVLVEIEAEFAEPVASGWGVGRHAHDGLTRVWDAGRKVELFRQVAPRWSGREPRDLRRGPEL